jgi:hypothetical protein
MHLIWSRLAPITLSLVSGLIRSAEAAFFAMGWSIVRPVAVIPRRYPYLAWRALVDLVDLPAWRALFDYKDLPPWWTLIHLIDFPLWWALGVVGFVTSSTVM